jgi:hypothetical protein
MLSIQRSFPDYFANLIFVSVAVHDSGTFKGHNETVYQVERRLHWKGLAMSVLPVRVGAGQRTAPVMAQGAE